MLDDDVENWGGAIDGEPIVGGLDLTATFTDHAIPVCADGGRARRSIVQRADALGVARGRYVGAVHPRLTVP